MDEDELIPFFHQMYINAPSKMFRYIASFRNRRHLYGFCDSGMIMQEIMLLAQQLINE